MNHNQHSGANLSQPRQSIEIIATMSISNIKALMEENVALKAELDHKSEKLIEIATKLETLNDSYEVLLTVATKFRAELDKLKQQA